MAELNSDYNAGREHFEVLIADYNGRRSVAQFEITDLIDRMKQETTPEEWKVISQFQLKRLHPRQLAYTPQAEEG